MTRLITDEKFIMQKGGHLCGEVSRVLKEFKAFKIERGLTSPDKIEDLTYTVDGAKIEGMNDTLDDIGCEIGYISNEYWSFTSKLKAADRSLDVFCLINNMLGWLSVELQDKKIELHKAYPVLLDD
jgi:hypothetical protein